MKRLLSIFALFLLSAPAWATTYYLANASTSPVGNDSNNGLSAGAPWLTPNHAVNCGDVILAAASTAYVASNFNQSSWGTSTCAAGNNVAWMKCATFDACKITAAGYSGIWVSQSYWGVQGWEVSTTSAPDGPCFAAEPATTSGPSIHHIIFANDICNGAYGSGFFSITNGVYGVDYLAVLGTITYNATQGASECWSGINIVTPVASDLMPGTHIYVAGNFTWNNFNPSPCAGITPTDGEGIQLDTWTGYTQQGVVTNNISFLNGQAGIRVGIVGSAKHIYVLNNTTYGNNGDSSLANGDCAEIADQASPNTEISANLARTNAALGCGGGTQTNYVFGVWTPCNGSVVYGNFGYSAAGNNTNGSTGCGGFTFGPNNTFGTDPAFANAPATNPGAPSCGSATSVLNCMATVIANFTPTAAVAKPYGYQAVSTTSRYDPLYPQWLCSVTNLPTGLVTPGCVSASAKSNMTMNAGASAQ